MKRPDFEFPLNDPLTQSFFERLKRHLKRVVFSEGEDIRILYVAEKMVEMQIGLPILLGNKERIQKLASDHDINLDFVNITDPKESSDLDLFCKRFEKIEKYKGMHIENAREMISSPYRFAAMMVQYGHADAYVGGNSSKATTILRAVQQLLKPDADVPHVYATTLLLAPHLEHFGRNGYMLLADTAINPEPDTQELAAISVTSGVLAQRLFETHPRVVLLSHSTKGSNFTASARRVAAAAELAHDLSVRKMCPMEIDGELQADVALNPLAAEKKAPHMDQKGPVDALVFPNLDSAHISSKLLQHTSGAKAYGQFIMGLERPVAQIPVTADVDMILGTVAAVSIEAITANKLAISRMANTGQL